VCVLAAAAVTAGPEQAGDWSCRAAARALGGWLAAMPALRAQPRLRSAAWLVCMRLRLRPAPAAACAPSLFVSPLNAVRVKGAIRARAPADGSRWLAAFSPGPNPPSRATTATRAALVPCSLASDNSCGSVRSLHMHRLLLYSLCVRGGSGPWGDQALSTCAGHQFWSPAWQHLQWRRAEGRAACVAVCWVCGAGGGGGCGSPATPG